MKNRAVTPRHMAFVEALLNGLQREFADLPGEEMLAVACQLVGRMVALQDQSRFTAEAVMQIVASNIEKGNQDVVEGFVSMPAGGHA